MITQFDDYCIHQTVDPINQPSSSDRNFYDRYWANGFSIDGGYMFEMALGIYPNRSVMDAHFGILIDGVQHCFHVSRRAPSERVKLTAGPLSFEIVKPLESFRLHIEPNHTEISCDLTFVARSRAQEEPRSLLYDENRLIMNTTRYTQIGCWHGYVVIKGRRIEVLANQTGGARDKSWGIRPVGERESGAPSKIYKDPRVYWVWAPLDFGDFSTQFNTFENADGTPTQLAAHKISTDMSLGLGASPKENAIGDIVTARHTVNWIPGTRHAAGAVIELVDGSGLAHEIKLTSLLTFYVAGIGYHHPTWAHGVWKGEEVVDSESWVISDLDPLAYQHIHVHHMVKATLGDSVGYGTLETLCFGPHDRSGFKGFLDGAPHQAT